MFKASELVNGMPILFAHSDLRMGVSAPTGGKEIRAFGFSAQGIENLEARGLPKHGSGGRQEQDF